MRIFIDARVIQDHFPGIGRYVFNLIDAMAPQLDGELLALVATHTANTRYDLAQLRRHPNVELIPSDVSIFSWRSQTALPRLIRRLNPDLLHFPYNLHPLTPGRPSILTLYDVIPRRFPTYFSPPSRWKIEAIQRVAIRFSERFVAISQATAADFRQLYRISPERITVTPLAPDPVFHPRAQSELADYRRKMNLAERYFLYLGANKPHKNLPRLIRAWAKVREQRAGIGGQLVVAGHWDKRYPEAKELAVSLGVSDSVRFLGAVLGADLPLLYAAATAFIFPSLYEGFGLPVLEAMACGTPVACSRAPGLNEVTGQAALTFDPYSVGEMADVIIRLGTDSSLRDQLIRRGMKRAASFSWENTARLTLQAYQELLK